MLAKNIMQEVTILNTPNCPIRNILSSRGCGVVVLGNDGKPVGIVMKEWLLNLELENWSTTVASLMTQEFRVVLSDEFLTEDAPIIETIVLSPNGHIEGLITRFDLLREMNKRLECQAQEVMEMLTALIEASHDGVMITDSSGNILNVNKAHEILTGIEPDEILNKNIFDLTHHGLFSDPLVDLVIKRREPVTVLQNTTRNNVMITGSPVYNREGVVHRIVINFRDITEHEQLRYELTHSKRLTERYSSELTELRHQLTSETGLVAQAPAMKKVVDLCLRMAKVDSTVLLLGESGVGKEVLTKLIHTNSNRSLGSFIRVNCGAIPKDLLESELFGYEPGAFTGASKNGKVGLFELADHGTIFLDEIGDLPFFMQSKMLRVLQEREITRVGGGKPRKINVRILTATNRNLRSMVEQKEFREDLYFRLNVVPITIPPLRERKEDIIPLIYNCKERVCSSYKIEKDISPEVIKVFLEYSWPGNVRELENVIERMVVSSLDRVLTLKDLPEEVKSHQNPDQMSIIISGLMPLKKALLEVEEQLIAKALQTYGSTYKVAKVLEISQPTAVRKINRFKRMLKRV